MQAGDFDATGDVLPAITRRIYVNGVHRHHVSDSWDAEIGSDLPEQVSAVTGIKARTGNVTFAPHQTVTTTAPSPLRREGGWPPQRGDELIIWDEYPTYRYRRATATVTDVRAGLGEGEVDVEWTDDLEASLSTPSEQSPIARGMPGEEVSVSGELRRYMARTGIEPWGIVVSALHDAGYRLLPSVSNVDFMCLVQGNLYPRIGYLAAANATGNVLEWDNTSGFQYVSNWAEFTPGFADHPSGHGFGIYLRKTAGGPTAQTQWTMSDGAQIRLNLSSTSAILSRTVSGVTTTLVRDDFTSTSSLPWAAVNIGSVSVRMVTENGVKEATYGSIGINWSRVRTIGAAALMVAYAPLAGWPGFNWPSLRFRGAGPALVRETVCTRTIENRTVRDILSDISAATLTGFWLDEYGILQWMPSNHLESQSPVATITTRSDVLAGSWSETIGGVASSVVTTYDECALTQTSTVRVVVGESSGSRTMNAGDVEEGFVGPGAAEEWILPDMSPLPAGQDLQLMTERAQRSWWGGSYVASKGETEDSTTYQWAHPPHRNYLAIQVEDLTPRQWKVTHTVAAGSPQVQLVTLPGEGTQVPIPWRDQPLPIWRARGRASFVEASYISRLGPAWAATYRHELGAWGNRQDARRVGDYLGSRMSSVQIVLSGLSVVHDPRRQLGDVVEVNADVSLGGVLRCLVVGIHESSSVRGIDQKLDLRVIRATPSVRKVYADIESTTLPYSGIESATAPYADLEA